MALAQELMEKYWGPLWYYLKDHSELKRRICAFLLKPERLALYFGPTHLVIEYFGPVGSEDFSGHGTLMLAVFDYPKSDNFLEKVLGVNFSSKHDVTLQLAGHVENLFVPSNDAFDILHQNGWNFAAESMQLVLNPPHFEVRRGDFCRLNNCFFYGTNETGLAVRHVQWMDFLPLEWEDLDDTTEAIKITYWPNITALIEHDASYQFPIPDEFDLERLSRLNRFVELISNSATGERTITSFLAERENQFILKMAFFGKEVHAQRNGEWADAGQGPFSC